jgi:hypothetical protein
MKGTPYGDYNPNEKPGMFRSYWPIIAIAVAVFCFYSLIYFMYTSMYNESMVRCLQSHSQDVCTEALR